jgi:hypothetical protein
MNEKPQVVRSPEPRVGAARDEEELLRVAEIVLGRRLEGRDRLARSGTAESAKRPSAQAGQTAGMFSLMSGGVLKLTGRAIDIAQDAYRGAVAQMQRLTVWEDADAEADAREAIEEKSPAEEAERKAAEENLAAVAGARREEARQAVEEKALDEAAREVAEAQARAAAQEAAKRQTAENARLKAEEAARKAVEGKPKSDAEAKEQAERAEADLAQERARTQALEQQLSMRQDDQKQLAQERVRTQALEQQLAAREDEQKLLAQERARTQALEQQLAAREDEQKLLAQERARTQALEQQLSIRQDDQELLAPEAPDNLEVARLMAQARLLLDQGNIIAARSVLERAAESGSALALFLLAETYDPASLSAWGIFGRRGNVKKARELYTKAVARGVHAAEYRLSALR